MSQTSPQPFRFLDLPTEIREKIYIYLVSSPHPINLSPTTYTSTPFLHGLPRTFPLSTERSLYLTFPSSLLLSCVQIHQELLPIYFTHNTFTLIIRKHNDTYSTFLCPTSSFRQNLLSIRTLRLVVLRFGSKNYFAGTVVPILEECILNGNLRNLEVWVKDTSHFSSPLGGYPGAGGLVAGRRVSAEFDNWGLLKRLCRDPWLENVSLEAGWVDEYEGELERGRMTSVSFA